MIAQKEVQALIADIDRVIPKTNSPVSWFKAGDMAAQRKVLERVRRYLVSLQQKSNSAKVSSGELDGNSYSKDSISTFSQEMESIRMSILEPLHAEIENLRVQREHLVKEIRQLEMQRLHHHSLSQQQAKQQQIIAEVLPVLLNRLEESFNHQLSQTLSKLETKLFNTEVQEIKRDYNGSLNAPLHPRERLEHLQQMQIHSDELLMNLDVSTQAVLQSIQSNILMYQDSLGHNLHKMHDLSVQGELILANFIHQLNTQLDLPNLSDKNIQLPVSDDFAFAGMELSDDQTVLEINENSSEPDISYFNPEIQLSEANQDQAFSPIITNLDSIVNNLDPDDLLAIDIEHNSDYENSSESDISYFNPEIQLSEANQDQAFYPIITNLDPDDLLAIDIENNPDYVITDLPEIFSEDTEEQPDFIIHNFTENSSEKIEETPELMINNLGEMSPIVNDNDHDDENSNDYLELISKLTDLLPTVEVEDTQNQVIDLIPESTEDNYIAASPDENLLLPNETEIARDIDLFINSNSLRNLSDDLSHFASQQTQEDEEITISESSTNYDIKTSVINPIITPEKIEETSVIDTIITPEKIEETSVIDTIITPEKIEDTSVIDTIITSEKIEETSVINPIITSEKIEETSVIDTIITPEKIEETSVINPIITPEKIEDTPVINILNADRVLTSENVPLTQNLLEGFWVELNDYNDILKEEDWGEFEIEGLIDDDFYAENYRNSDELYPNSFLGNLTNDFDENAITSVPTGEEGEEEEQEESREKLNLHTVYRGISQKQMINYQNIYLDNFHNDNLS